MGGAAQNAIPHNKSTFAVPFKKRTDHTTRCCVSTVDTMVDTLCAGDVAGMCARCKDLRWFWGNAGDLLPCSHKQQKPPEFLRFIIVLFFGE